MDDEQAGWRPDILGDGFEQRTLTLGEDDEGELVATLVRFVPDLSGPGAGVRPPASDGSRAGADVLYVHGWSDYFFQVEHARFWHDRGARFYALDLRKYGRSLRPGQTPGFTTDLRHYFRDVEAALAVMGHGILPDERSREDRPLVLVGHSTGGLTLSLWAAAFPGRATALVLNSPWLEFQAGATGRAVVAPALGLRSRLQPRGRMVTVDLGFYTRTVSSRFEGSGTTTTPGGPSTGSRCTPAGWTPSSVPRPTSPAGSGSTSPCSSCSRRARRCSRSGRTRCGRRTPRSTLGASRSAPCSSART
ncbi:hypothetical protein GCM10025864_27090 [Luteimicrobium album]|uniref:Serine aminopeptidase S33 domain-containing protein n=1 Tax=Luteimicrobium album TaxID=1054550 RepID=A0ABQ6I369_9MICO|nr:hypothetical protein GCM10025864_27090 [Luteimicrobium album]